LVERGRVDDAITLLECVLEAAPDHAMSHNALGFCRQRRGEARKAIAHFREAARLDPKRSEPLNNLAWILAASKDPEVRDVEEAIALAERAVALADEGSRLECLGTLTKACGEAGRWDKAEEAARQALEIARARGNARLAGQIQARLEECRRKSPPKDPSPAAETPSPPGALWRGR